MSDAYEQGWSAYQFYKEKAQNPFGNSYSREWKEWEQGWLDAYHNCSEVIF